jgi:hypothetical protein
MISGLRTDQGAKPTWRDRLVLGFVIFCTVAAFSNSFSGAFVFDDQFAILENPTIRELWPITRCLCPPADGSPVTARPILNFTFAANYIWTGYEKWSYHAVNLLIHLFATGTLFSILWRTCNCPTISSRWRSTRLSIAASVSLLWAIHPL